MAAEIPEEAKKLLEGKNFAHVSTLMPDGSPQSSPVWIGHENGTVTFNTARGRLKEKNLERDPRVAVSVHNQDNPYESLLIRGKVKEITAEGGKEDADALAKRYMGVDEYPFLQPGEERLIVRIEPEKVNYTPPQEG
jgi:PPOX class probable F420-dependent enzyme